MKISNKIKEIIREWLCRHCEAIFFYDEKDMVAKVCVSVFGLKCALFLAEDTKEGRKIVKFFPLLD